MGTPLAVFDRRRKPQRGRAAHQLRALGRPGVNGQRSRGSPDVPVSRLCHGQGHQESSPLDALDISSALIVVGAHLAQPVGSLQDTPEGDQPPVCRGWP